jgi:hypothetical protein
MPTITLKSFSIAVLLLVATLPLDAMTRMGRGRVVQVEAGTPGDPRRPPRVLLLGTWHGPPQPDALIWVPLTENGIWLVDGERLTPAEVVQRVKPGAVLKLIWDLPYGRFSTRSETLPAAAAVLDPAAADYLVRLPKVGELSREDQTSPAELVLHLAVREGRVVHAAASCHTKITYGSDYDLVDWHEVVADGLSLADGRLRGRCVVRLVPFAGSKEPPSDRTVELDVAVAADGTLSGNCGGDAGGAVSGNATIPRAIDGDQALWLGLDAWRPAGDKRPSDAKVVWKRLAGVCTGDHASITKSYPSGTVDAVTMTWNGTRLNASLTATWHGGEAAPITIDAWRIGECIFGTWTSGERQGRCRGQVLAADCLSLAGWEESPLKKAVAAGTYPE